MVIRPPKEGTQVHAWVFATVSEAKRLGYPDDYIFKTFRAAYDEFYRAGKLHRNPTDRDIQQALTNCLHSSPTPEAPPAPMVYNPTTGWNEKASPPKGELDLALVERALSESPVKTIADIPPSIGHWHQLFKPNELLCVGYAADNYRAVRASELGEHPDAQFIVPNPLRKRLGFSKSGRLTSHCRDATGPRRFIVMENDHGFTSDDQVAILFWVSQKTQTNLRLIVRSGGKSVHGWFDASDAPEPAVFKWVKSVVRLGFDQRLYLPEQFARFPGGYRPDKETRQEILYTSI